MKSASPGRRRPGNYGQRSGRHLELVKRREIRQQECTKGRRVSFCGDTGGGRGTGEGRDTGGSRRPGNTSARALLADRRFIGFVLDFLISTGEGKVKEGVVFSGRAP